jgi:exosortase/archaeosortase
LRFLTSEVLLRLSALLGMTTARTSFDTIEVQGRLLQIVVSCTFAELFFASMPLIWKLDRSLLRNALRLVLVACTLFALNVLRLELGQIAYSHGVPWMLAHDIPLGFVYFAVWAVIWRARNWCAWRVSLSTTYRSPFIQATRPLR